MPFVGLECCLCGRLGNSRRSSKHDMVEYNLGQDGWKEKVMIYIYMYIDVCVCLILKEKPTQYVVLVISTIHITSTFQR